MTYSTSERSPKPARRLLAILASPPLATSGSRTRARLTLAARLIGCDTFAVANLISIPTTDVLDISVVGHEKASWCDARIRLAAQLDDAEDVLLGWGCTEPVGAARKHHRSQVAWLRTEVSRHGFRPWTLGGKPRHPSRWQRYTARYHNGLPFVDALAEALHQQAFT